MTQFDVIQFYRGAIMSELIDLSSAAWSELPGKFACFFPFFFMHNDSIQMAVECSLICPNNPK